MLTQEELFINEDVESFINAEPELYQFNLGLIQDEGTPSVLHFCYYHLEHYPNLMGQLSFQEYRKEFAINASIFYGNTVRDFIKNGELPTRANELAREEVRLLYIAYNEAPVSRQIQNFIEVVTEA